MDTCGLHLAGRKKNQKQNYTLLRSGAEVATSVVGSASYGILCTTLKNSTCSLCTNCRDGHRYSNICTHLKWRFVCVFFLFRIFAIDEREFVNCKTYSLPHNANSISVIHFYYSSRYSSRWMRVHHDEAKLLCYLMLMEMEMDHHNCFVDR